MGRQFNVERLRLRPYYQHPAGNRRSNRRGLCIWTHGDDFEGSLGIFCDRSGWRIFVVVDQILFAS